MRFLLAILVLNSLVKFHRCEVIFESLCSSEAEVSGMSSIDGNDEFEIDLYDNKFLPEDTILRKSDVLSTFALIFIHFRFLAQWPLNKSVKIMVYMNLLFEHLIMMVMSLDDSMIDKRATWH